MLAPHRLIIRLGLAIITVAVFAVAYLIALALEAPTRNGGAVADNCAADLPEALTEALEDANLASGGPALIHETR